ncbi:hypothetical protein D320_14041 [Haloferax sp. BAB-2207]|nr:hypothetical protein D320_14041 [Haloferax sp. BAB-2207]
MVEDAGEAGRRDQPRRERGRTGDDVAPEVHRQRAADEDDETGDRREHADREADDDDECDVDGGTRETAVLAGVFRSPE